MRTYLERDVRQLIKVLDLGTFQRFLRLWAGRTGQLPNLSSLANDIGITHIEIMRTFNNINLYFNEDINTD